MSWMVAVNKALSTHLSTHAALTTALGAGTRIWPGISLVDPPYVVFFLSGGGYVLDVDARQIDVRYTVKAVTNSKQTADEIADILAARLQDGALSIDGYGLIRCTVTTALQLSEVIERRQYWHSGHLVRIRAA